MPPIKTQTSISPGGYSKQDFYSEETTTDDFVGVDFIDSKGDKFVSGGIQIVCDSVNPIVYSFDGLNIHGELRQQEAQTFDSRNRECVFFRSLNPASPGTVRLYVW